MIHYWEVWVKYLDENAIAPLLGEILWFVANLQVYLKVRRNRLLQVHDISWKFTFRKYIHFDSDRCSKKKDVVLRFEKPYDGVFLVIQRNYFLLKSVMKTFTRAPLNGNLRAEIEKLEILISNSYENSYLKCSKKRILHICYSDLAEFVFKWRSPI